MDAKEVLILITGAHKAYALHMVSRNKFKAKKVTLGQKILDWKY